MLLPGFALVLFRVAGLMVTAPLFAGSSIPAQLKIAFSFVVAAMLFPQIIPTLPAHLTLSVAVTGIFGEMLIGLIIGVTMSIVIMGVELAGMMIGQQAGIALASVVDPSSNAQSTVVGQVYMITTMFIFLTIGGHRMMMAALMDTFDVVPVLGFGLGEAHVELIADVITAAFILAIKLFSPVLIALMMTTLTLGFLSRTIPQLNILSIGFALRTMVAIGVASMALAASQDVIVEALLGALDRLRRAFELSPLDV